MSSNEAHKQEAVASSTKPDNQNDSCEKHRCCEGETHKCCEGGAHKSSEGEAHKNYVHYHHKCFGCEHKNEQPTAPPAGSPDQLNKCARWCSKSVISDLSKTVDKTPEIEQKIRSVEDFVRNTEGIVGEAVVEIVDGPIDMMSLITSCAQNCPAVGGIGTFLGVTRDNFDQRPVTKLVYECYSSMSMRQMKHIVAEIFKKFNGVRRVVISHRIGECPVKDASVFIAVAAEHRQSALEGTAFAINTLKERVPIWKKEFYVGESPESECNPTKVTEASTFSWKKNKEFLEKNPASPTCKISPSEPPAQK